MSFVDPNGKWSFPVHRDITRVALQGYVSKAVLAQLIDRQKIMDIDQTTGGSFKHAMYGSGENPAQAQLNMWGYVVSNLNSGNDEGLGNAIHSLQDYAAPGHTDGSFMPIEWSGRPVRHLGSTIAHWLGENSGSDDWSRFGYAVQLSMSAFMWFDPKGAQSAGLTPDTFDSRYEERISAYVDSYYQGLLARSMASGQGGYFALQHAFDLEGEAARMCALGAPAACVR